jgi:hypothetical protein
MTIDTKPLSERLRTDAEEIAGWGAGNEAATVREAADALDAAQEMWVEGSARIADEYARLARECEAAARGSLKVYHQIYAEIATRIAADIRVLKAGTKYRMATFTCDQSEEAVVGPLYYFKIIGAPPPPYRVQRHVEAIIDVADDGTLAGVELIDNMPPPPLQARPSDAKDALLREAREFVRQFLQAATEDKSIVGYESDDVAWLVDEARTLLSKLTEATKP